jgi:hypothetical protein
VLERESINFTGMFVSICNCARGYLRVELFSFNRVITLDLVNIFKFQLVSCLGVLRVDF